ncbi:ribonuclease domain-containing protein [Rhodococcus tukisamuensis]|uniref:Guanyl-specific ribonuclease Sa n=1 Tax=Rhodococcus tukisamuensis TaxID=168276 RepID=A0A1G6Y512_9NOCA|nr:ribonuclease domain-containing protein [Rhodococcus tukisamuensis]SDD85488.1 Guanyl-specific ribonuclease Sa [Rhodococcus tukisamuensis]
MSRLGTRSRVVVGVLLLVLLGLVAYATAGSGGGTGQDTMVAESVTTTQAPVTSTMPQRLVVEPDGSVTDATSTRARTATSSQAATPAQTAGPRGVVPAAITAAAFATLAEIDAGDWPDSANAPGTKGGDPWRNRDRTLPAKTGSGATVSYREWDVNPKRRGETRDAERIVTGSDGSAWYTADHYTSFVRMR